MSFNRKGEFIRDGKKGFDPNWVAPKTSSKDLENISKRAIIENNNGDKTKSDKSKSKIDFQTL